jgi:hypothetical protein
MLAGAPPLTQNTAACGVINPARPCARGYIVRQARALLHRADAV